MNHKNEEKESKQIKLEHKLMNIKSDYFLKKLFNIIQKKYH